MGGSSWSDDSYVDRVTTRASTGTPTFDYDAAVKSGAAAPKVHNRLDPMGLKVRESRDSAAHPNSNAIMVNLDVTGSMGSVVGRIHASLPKLMGLLGRKGYIEDPQILFSAIGDAKCDKSPTQVGQFESGLEMEDDLSKFHIEGGGGGSNQESYELMAYVGARKTSTDCFEKRGRKGYAFFIGDELPYGDIRKNEVERIFGEKLQSDLSTEQIFNELREKFNVFVIIPKGSNNAGSAWLKTGWAKYVGMQNILDLENPEGAAELIALQIGLCEGNTDVDSAVKDMVDVGTSMAIVRATTDSVSKSVAGGSITKVAKGAITPSGGKSDIERL